MKKTPFSAVLLASLLFSGCSGNTAVCETVAKSTSHQETAKPAAESAPETVSAAAPSKDKPRSAHLFECGDTYVDKADVGFALIDQNGAVIREYSDFRILSAIEKDGSITEIPYALGIGESALTVYTFDKENGEHTAMNAEYSAKFFGDFLVIDHVLYTAKLRMLGQTHALYLPEMQASFDEPIHLGYPSSVMEIRFYLAGVKNGKAAIPRADDDTDYLTLKNTIGNNSIGIFRENGEFRYRTFTVDTGHITPRGVYVREESSVASITGRIAGYDLYMAPDVNFLADPKGNIVLCESGRIVSENGFITVYPHGDMSLCSVYSSDLQLIADRCNIIRPTKDGGLILWQGTYTDAPADADETYILGDHRISVITQRGRLITLTECDNVYALTDYGALVENDGKLWLLFTDGSTAELTGWNKDLTYTGQARIGEYTGAPDYFIFTDGSDKNEKGAPMRYEWCYDYRGDELTFRAYHASGLHENVSVITRSH